MDEKVQVYADITGFTPSCFQQDLIAMRVQDVGRWRKAVIWWMSNDYRPQSVGKVLDYYDQMEKENGTGQKPNGFSKRTDADVIAESADFYERYIS